MNQEEQAVAITIENVEILRERLEQALHRLHEISRAPNETAIYSELDRIDAFLASQQGEQPECGCCGQTGPCDPDCDTLHPEEAEGAQGARDALQSVMEWTEAENIPTERKLCLIRNAARAALAAQPSPAPVAYVLFRDGDVCYEADDNIVIGNTPGDETDLYKWLPVYTAPVAPAWQVPEGWYLDAPSQVEAAIIDIRGMWGEDDCPTYEDVAGALRRLLGAAPQPVAKESDDE